MTEFLFCFSCCIGEQPQPRRRRIDRSMIGEPMNFVHTAHVGSGDSNAGFAMSTPIAATNGIGNTYTVLQPSAQSTPGFGLKKQQNPHIGWIISRSDEIKGRLYPRDFRCGPLALRRHDQKRVCTEDYSPKEVCDGNYRVSWK